MCLCVSVVCIPVLHLRWGKPQLTPFAYPVCIISVFSMKALDDIYERLDITLETVGESFYQDMMQDVVSTLDKKGLVCTFVA